jgi:wyosine [tRNA(Phe)-imidazoG37] synthetase (radical SAM superfamily)
MRTLYGPVDSWRFGRSLGLDPLAARHKLCPFSCLYCQYGETRHPCLQRQAFVTAEQLHADLAALPPQDVDCITFAGLGEPTLAANLPALLDAVRKRFTQPTVLLTGGALLPDNAVQRDLTAFDRVAITLNAPNETLFRHINRPAPRYPYAWNAFIAALRRFRQAYEGQLIVHIMLIQANRAYAPHLAALARQLNPDQIHLNTPLKPALGGPLSPQEMQTAARAFEGLPVRVRS